MLRINNFVKQGLVVGFQFQLQNTRQGFIVLVLAYLLFFSVKKLSQSRVCSDPEGFLYLFFGDVHG